MRTILVYLVLLVSCWAASQPQSRTVTGTVINAASGVPIRHALVQVSGTVQPVSVLTGPDGRFQLDNIPEGRVMITAQKPGFFDFRNMPQGALSQLDPMVTVGAGKNDFRVMLFPAARIVGRVIDEDGEAAENISVQVLSEQIVQGRKILSPQNTSTTDDDGAYRIDGLVPGRFKVFANSHVMAPQKLDASPEVSVPVYYPDSRESISGQQIELKPGQEARADFRLHSERGFQVKVAIGGIPDKAHVGFSFENASGQSVMFGPMNFDQSKGEFTAKAVPSGTWTLILSANAGTERQYEARQEIVVDNADVNDIQVSLQPLVVIPVKVNHAIPTGQSSAPPEMADMPANATLISMEPYRFRAYGQEPQGTPPVFAFRNVAPGRYKLDVQPVTNECLESAWYGSTDLGRDPLIIGSSAEPQPLTINLRADCAKVTIKLPAGDLPRTGSVLFVPDSSLGEPHNQQVVSGSSFPFVLSPGSYRVFALTTFEGVEYTNPEALRGYPSQTVNLDPGLKLELAVELSERISQ